MGKKYINFYETIESATEDTNLRSPQSSYIRLNNNEKKLLLMDTDNDDDELLIVGDNIANIRLIKKPQLLSFKCEDEKGCNIFLYDSDGIEYSLDNKTTWNWLLDNKISLNYNEIAYLRGKRNKGFDGTKVEIHGMTSCHGNIMSLIDYETFPDIIPYDYCFSKFFCDCTDLLTAPELPATTLAEGCYSGMFDGCTSLVNAPDELPATTLASNCYSQMFQSCTSLVTAPALPATILSDKCYELMFNGCTSLVNAPELPATTLASGCYSWMFYGTNVLPDCSNIDFTSSTVVASGGLQGLFCGTKITDSQLDTILKQHGINNYSLPCTALINYCYLNMFQDCTSLVTAPALPATTLATRCYYCMFYGCTSLVTAPELPATTLASECYGYMLYGCTSLTTAPDELPATTLASKCYDNMFGNCTSLVTVPELPATILTEDCYKGMFKGCSKLNYIKCLATNISASSCTSNWVLGVNGSGSFVVPNSMQSAWNNKGAGGSGKPKNFDYVDA